MKISKIKWKAHPVLGDLELNFMNSATTQPYETILFAGENGAGKTTILEAISTFLNGGEFAPFEYIEYITGGKILKAVPWGSAGLMYGRYNMLEGSHPILVSRLSPPNSQNLDNNPLGIRNSGCIFSRARADYRTERIQYTTTKQLDTDKFNKDVEENFTALKQLIIDIQTQDSVIYTEKNQELDAQRAPAQTWSTYYPNSKMYRFQNAFDTFFDKLKYEGIKDVNSEKEIFFQKNGKSIAINNLSTGEKQIVFRGIHLLKNNKVLDGAIILIDEPELSMHPKWQKNILQYYKNLFTDAGVQKTQLLVATHSEHVLSDALKDKDKNLVIVLTDDAGVIEAKRIDASFTSVLPSITSAETNYLAFDIVSNDYHIELYGWLQTKKGKHTVKSCDGFICAHNDYDATIHKKPYRHNATRYKSLCTYIRNTIDHPDPNTTYSEEELRVSIELLRKLCS